MNVKAKIRGCCSARSRSMNADKAQELGIGIVTAVWGRARAALAAWRIASLVTAGLLCGCISRPHLDVRTYAFAVLPASRPDAGFRSHRLVAIRALRVAAPFDGRSLVYRMGEYSFESDPYAEFFVSASESLLLPIRNYLRQSGTFEAVVEPGSALRPNTLAEVNVHELYGDFRRPGEPAALLRLRVLLFESPNGVPGKLILEREYSRRIPLKA